MPVIESIHRNREEASAEAAERIAALLRIALNEAGDAALVVSGGSTPVACFRRLASTALPWQHVTVTLSDERWVPPTHDDSNSRMLRETLLRSKAARAVFLPFVREQQTIESACEALAAEVAALPRPIAVSLLGMGEDGHFASLFPDAAGLEQALDVAGSESIVHVQTAASPHPRISMTLSTLLDSREIILLIFGATKREVLGSARDGPGSLPVSRLLNQEHTLVRVIWAP